MPVDTAAVTDGLVLSRAGLRVEIARRPFAIDVRRDARRLVRGLGIWCAAVSYTHLTLPTKA